MTLEKGLKRIVRARRDEEENHGSESEDLNTIEEQTKDSDDSAHGTDTTNSTEGVSDACD